MKSNHQLSFDQEVKKPVEYGQWKLKIDTGDSVDIVSDTLVTLLAGTNMSLAVSGNVITLNAAGTGGVVVQGTIPITENTILSASHNQKTLLCKNSAVDIIITIPTGLGSEFTCNFISVESGTRFTEIIDGAGFTSIAPHGRKLLTGYSCNLIKESSLEKGHLQGELTV